MSAAARAEARRKAILSRGTDRLAKLTTSARGEDAPAYLHDGEDSSNMPSPAARASPSPSPSPQPARTTTDPSRNTNMFEGLGANAPDPSAGGVAGGGMFPPFGPGWVEPKEKSKLQKVLPLLHLLAMWCLLAYFVLWGEPKVHKDLTGEDLGLGVMGLWKRWADLGQKSPLLANSLQTFRIHVVPFFWAFTTLQIGLHSLRIFSGFDSVQPPTLVALALPHLPPPLPSIIINSLKYMQMGSLFLDDLSGLVVGIGFIIYFSGWIAQTQT
ncbi:hypothetical protein BDZ97DRAFT_1901133 [Flammula alnicola]|nr:hypothetical protein BDZ97DRAFT_1901133 [Flammula alnicola]